MSVVQAQWQRVHTAAAGIVRGRSIGIGANKSGRNSSGGLSDGKRSCNCEHLAVMKAARTMRRVLRFDQAVPSAVNYRKMLLLAGSDAVEAILEHVERRLVAKPHQPCRFWSEMPASRRSPSCVNSIRSLSWNILLA
jgi:hypothetical protein